jgi:hypothetical protein
MTEGTKYHPLFEHLLFSGQGRLSMTFAEIEDVIEARLPPSARRREEWWSNSPNGHSQARAWLRAGYRTSGVDLARETIEFNLEGWPEGYRQVSFHADRSSEHPKGSGMSEPPQADYDVMPDVTPSTSAPMHPLFGIWEGKVTLVPGYDYTQPAFDDDAA